MCCHLYQVCARNNEVHDWATHTQVKKLSPMHQPHPWSQIDRNEHRSVCQNCAMTMPVHASLHQSLSDWGSWLV